MITFLALGLPALLVAATGYGHPKPQQAVEPQTVHVVRPGESLSLLAKRYQVSVRALVEANSLVQPDHLRVGQRLVIPREAESTPATRTVKRRSAQPLAPPRHFVLATSEFDGRSPVFGWPVEGPVSSQFGRRRTGWHSGIDIKVEMGTPIFAAADGSVYYSGWEARYGRVIKIQHSDGFVTVYAHNLQNFLEVGDEVSRGQVIGTVGRTGRAWAYHLHFEIRNNGKVYDPLHFLPALEVPPETGEATQPEEDEDDAE